MERLQREAHAKLSRLSRDSIALVALFALRGIAFKHGKRVRLSVNDSVLNSEQVMRDISADLQNQEAEGNPSEQLLSAPRVTMSSELSRLATETHVSWVYSWLMTIVSCRLDDTHPVHNA